MRGIREPKVGCLNESNFLHSSRCPDFLHFVIACSRNCHLCADTKPVKKASSERLHGDGAYESRFYIDDKKGALVKLKSRNSDRLLVGSSVLAMAIASAIAQAQDQAQQKEQTESATGAEKKTGDDDLTTVVVTGIRAALQSAAEIKRNSDTFVDSITASDVTSLPDLSVAEALQRVPGVTVSRFPTGGASPDFPSPEGRGNLIRGLGFVRSEFNGRDAFSANGGRALDWSSIPPELVGGVDVYKNQSADLIEGGIGGTINLCADLQRRRRQSLVDGRQRRIRHPGFVFLIEAVLDDQRLAAGCTHAAYRSHRF
jgi:hypothetical protein